jgi:hypothetical protein
MEVPPPRLRIHRPAWVPAHRQTRHAWRVHLDGALSTWLSLLSSRAQTRPVAVTTHGREARPVLVDSSTYERVVGDGVPPRVWSLLAVTCRCVSTDCRPNEGVCRRPRPMTFFTPLERESGLQFSSSLSWFERGKSTLVSSAPWVRGRRFLAIHSLLPTSTHRAMREANGAVPVHR